MRTSPALVVSLVVAVCGSAWAGPPIRQRQAVDAVFPNSFVSASCGLPVFQHNVGTFTFTVHANGEAAHELDTFVGTITFFAPSTGGSFGGKTGPIRFEYPEGIAVGAPAREIVLGRDIKVSGLPPDAGRYVYEGEIVDVVDGVPFVTVVPVPVESHGQNDIDDLIAAWCSALMSP